MLLCWSDKLEMTSSRDWGRRTYASRQIALRPSPSHFIAIIIIFLSCCCFFSSRVVVCACACHCNVYFVPASHSSSAITIFPPSLCVRPGPAYSRYLHYTSLHFLFVPYLFIRVEYIAVPLNTKAAKALLYFIQVSKEAHSGKSLNL